MSRKLRAPRTLAGSRIPVASLILLALGTATAATFAGPAVPAASRVSDVSLADLDVSTAEGMSQARQRLQAMARRVCAARAGGPSPTFDTCVESTASNALKQLAALRQLNVSARSSVTRAANVSLAGLDLSTLEGSQAAHARLEAMARRLCNELAGSRELTYVPNYAACVHDTLTGAWAQVNAIRAAKDMRTAQRTAP